MTGGFLERLGGLDWILGFDRGIGFFRAAGVAAPFSALQGRCFIYSRLRRAKVIASLVLSVQSLCFFTAVAAATTVAVTSREQARRTMRVVSSPTP